MQELMQAGVRTGEGMSCRVKVLRWRLGGYARF